MSLQFKHTQLDNGLTIVGEVNDAAHTAAVGFFVKTGARDERRELMGVSHFLEHMMFKGTARRTAADVNRDFDRIGANYNASTSQETTTYYAHVLPQFLPEAIDLLTDMLRPALRDEDFTMEKNVILEEIGMYADRPFWVAYEQAMAGFFADHTLGYRVLGTNESITALKRDQMLEYFNHRYSPDNIVVSLGGRFDFDRCVDQIASATKTWQRTGAVRDYAAPAACAGDERLTKSSVNMHYAVAVAPAPSVQDDLRYAAAVLTQVLGDSDGSRLYWKLIDPGLADEAEISHHGFDGAGVYLMYASCPPANAERVESIFFDVIDRAAEELNEAEVQRAASKIAMSMTLGSERPLGRMMGVGSHWLYLNQYVTLAEELDRVRAVNVDELKRLIEQYPFQPRRIVRMSPQ